MRCAAEVVRIQISKRWRNRGGARFLRDELQRGCVISNADPKRTFLQLVEPLELDPSFHLAVRAIRSRGTVAIVKLALSALSSICWRRGRFDAPRGPNSDRLDPRRLWNELSTIPSTDAYLSRPILDLTLPSITDPSLAPEGKHVMSAWVQFPPYHLARSGMGGCEGRVGGHCRAADRRARAWFWLQYRGP